MATLTLPSEELEIRQDVDLVVVGGGSAGIAAALSAARRGVRTVLVEEMPFLGGMSTGGCVGTFCGFYTQRPDGSSEALVGGLPLEIALELLKANHAYGPVPFKEKAAVLPYIPWHLKLLYEDLVRREANLTLYLHAKVTQCSTDRGRISGVAVHTREGRIALQARYFVDATGDAELCRLAGIETTLGDEIQYPSMMFTMQNVDMTKAISKLSSLPDLIAEHFASEALPRRGGNLIPTFRPGEVLVAMSRIDLDGRPVNGVDAMELTYGELEGRVQATRLAEFLRARFPGFEEAFISDSAPRLGIRETRKIVGEYTLTEEDVLGAHHFDDGVGRLAWPIERHIADGETLWKFLEAGTWYTLPYRSLLPRGIDNVLVAGRCLSADPDGFASARVIGACMLGGQAVGSAAAILKDRGGAARDVDVEQLRRDLADSGVPL